MITIKYKYGGRLELGLADKYYIQSLCGFNYDLHSDLIESLTEKVSVCVADINGDVLFEAKGELMLRREIKSNIYMFYVGEKNLDEILWKNVGGVISFDLEFRLKE